MPIVLTWMSFAAAATLPTECPIVVTGEEVAGLRAEVVAPAVISVTSELGSLAALYGDDACPAADGAACTASTGVAFTGRITTTDSRHAEECGWTYTLDSTVEQDTRASGLTAAPLDGAALQADGSASRTETTEACGEYNSEGAGWMGTVAVTGPWKELDASAALLLPLILAFRRPRRRCKPTASAPPTH